MPQSEVRRLRSSLHRCRSSACNNPHIPSARNSRVKANWDAISIISTLECPRGCGKRQNPVVKGRWLSPRNASIYAFFPGRRIRSSFSIDGQLAEPISQRGLLPPPRGTILGETKRGLPRARTKTPHITVPSDSRLHWRTGQKRPFRQRPLNGRC